jgi:hypothetical protein
MDPGRSRSPSRTLPRSVCAAGGLWVSGRSWSGPRPKTGARATSAAWGWTPASAPASSWCWDGPSPPWPSAARRCSRRVRMTTPSTCSPPARSAGFAVHKKPRPSWNWSAPSTRWSLRNGPRSTPRPAMPKAPCGNRTAPLSMRSGSERSPAIRSPFPTGRRCPTWSPTGPLAWSSISI